jgi:hypothetical protein
MEGLFFSPALLFELLDARIPAGPTCRILIPGSWLDVEDRFGNLYARNSFRAVHRKLGQGTYHPLRAIPFPKREALPRRRRQKRNVLT